MLLNIVCCVKMWLLSVWIASFYCRIVCYVQKFEKYFVT